MKKLLLIALLATPFLVTAQDVAKEQQKDESNIALFSAKTGALIKKSHGEVGKIRSASIETAVTTDMLTGIKSKGIRIEKPSSKQYGSDAIAFIDEDEIDGLLKSIALIKSDIMPSTPNEYTEVSFKSRSGFEAGCFWSKGEWSSYLKINKYNTDPYVWMQDGDLAEFEALVTEAYNKLETL